MSRGSSRIASNLFDVAQQTSRSSKGKQHYSNCDNTRQEQRQSHMMTPRELLKQHGNGAWLTPNTIESAPPTVHLRDWPPLGFLNLLFIVLGNRL
jgi:hypothetical protein